MQIIVNDKEGDRQASQYNYNAKIQIFGLKFLKTIKIALFLHHFLTYFRHSTCKRYVTPSP